MARDAAAELTAEPAADLPWQSAAELTAEPTADLSWETAAKFALEPAAELAPWESAPELAAKAPADLSRNTTANLAGKTSADLTAEATEAAEKLAGSPTAELARKACTESGPGLNELGASVTRKAQQGQPKEKTRETTMALDHPDAPWLDGRWRRTCHQTTRYLRTLRRPMLARDRGHVLLKVPGNRHV